MPLKMPSFLFNLAKGPLLRVQLLHMSEQQYVFLINMHHIISDGWSMDVMVKEVMYNYKRLLADEPLDMPPLSIQYKDYAWWQHIELQKEENVPMREYWLGRFSTHVPRYELPADRVWPPIRANIGAMHYFQLPEGMAKDITQFARQEGVTIFMLLLGIVKVLIYKYTHQTDITIGTPVAGRNHVDLENQIGFYVNTLPLRSWIDEAASFKSFLQKLRQTTLDAYKYQAFPFDKLVDELNLPIEVSRSPVFDIMVTYMKVEGGGEGTLGQLQVADFDQDYPISKFDLTVELVDSPGGMQIGIEYATDLFDKDRIERMENHLIQLFETVLHTPQTPIQQLSLLSEKERNTIFHEFNPPVAPYPAGLTLHGIIEEQVAKSPNGIAIRCDGRSLTFDELNKSANRRAHLLRDTYGLGPDNFVAILAERNEWIIITMLATLKAGAAWLPLDKGFPEERIQILLKDSGAKVLITDVSPAPNVSIPVLDIKDEDAGFAEHNPEHPMTGKELAYMLYTSGTTGKPKGVQIEHHHVIDYILYANEYFSIQPEDKILQQGSNTFDVSIEETFVALTSGATMVIAPKGGKDVARLIQIVQEEEVCFLSLTPALANEINEFEPDLPSVRILISGGDKLEEGFIDKLKQQNITFYNSYGPTETTIAATTAIVGEAKNTSNIGRPNKNKRIYIVNKHMQPQPIGIPGELCISGEGIGRGYLNQPDLTERTFIPNPFEPGMRLYKSGDLAQWLPDGTIDFMGRIDHQVKIRGFRIECGEIEHAIMQLGAEQAIVLALDDPSGNDKFLAGYVTGYPEEEILILKAKLGDRLPSYMIPAAFVVLDKMPINTSGKVDRKQLPIPDLDQQESNKITYPKTRVQKQLAIVWKEVLGVSRVGLEDNFFELGGHSLKAVRLLGRLSQQYGYSLELQDVFMYPSLKAMSERVEQARVEDYIPIPQGPVMEHYPLSHAQYRLWIISQVYPESTAYNMPEAYLLNGELNLDVFDRAWELLIERHESLRTQFHLFDKVPRQVILSVKDSGFAVRHLDFRDKTNAKENAFNLLEDEHEHIFNLSTGPLVKITLVQTEDNQYLCIINKHHILSDGWSFGVMINEVGNNYQQLIKDRNYSPEPLSIQYRDFVFWQNGLLENEEMAGHRTYWLERFKDQSPTLNLPVDYARPPRGSSQGSNHIVYLPKEITEKLKKIAATKGVSMYMLVLSILKVFLHKYTGQRDITTGTVVAGRSHVDLEPLIGLFINTLPIRSDINPEETFNQYLLQIRKLFVQAFKHQEYPFDLIVDELNLPRDLSRRNPLFDVFVSYETREDGTHGEDQQFEEQENNPGNNLIKFDLAFYCVETPDVVAISFSYASDLFSAERIKRMGKHLVELTETIVEDPKCKIQELSMLSQPEKSQLLIDFQPEVRALGTKPCLHTLFEEQARRQPDATAIVYRDESISYGALNKQADALAAHLIEMGVESGNFVGLLLDRSPTMLVSILAVLKAGAVYVPIDPQYPPSRISYILADTHAKMLISDQDFDVSPDTQLLLTNTFADLPDAAPKREEDKSARDLAYVIYTSGSTGTPKGVMIEHRNAVVMLEWAVQEFKQEPWDSMYFSTSYCFDLSVFEIFLPLITGKSLRLIEHPTEIRQYVEQDSRIMINTVPSTVRMLLDSQMDWSSVAVLNMAGEPIPAAILRQLDLNQTAVRNLYGPSEDTTYSTHFKIDRAMDTIPIGKAISHTQVYILNPEHQLQPVGVVGEIAISGAGLARGYLNQEELTAEKFIRNPFVPGEKMYLTGDLGKWDAEGNLVFLGRVDQQVKIRGYRIECGEVEHALIQAGAAEAVVMALDMEAQQEKSLVAYLTGVQQEKLPELRNQLKVQLPAYMIPSDIVFLESLPLNANGKLDRKQLPHPEREIQEERYVAPFTSEEKHLAALWQQILGIKKVGIYDDFFEVGGHSLSAIRMINALNKTLDTDLSLEEVFNFSTISGLAGRIAQSKDRDLWTQFSRGNFSTDIFLLPPALGMSAVFLPIANLMKSRANVYGYSFPHVSSDQKGLSMQQLVEDCKAGILKYHQPGNTCTILGYSMGGLLGYELVRELEAADISCQLVLIDCQGPLPETETGSWEIEEIFEAEVQPIRHVITEKTQQQLAHNFAHYIELVKEYQAEGQILSPVTVFHTPDNETIADWSNYTSATFTIHQLAGAHWEVFSPANRSVILQNLMLS